MSEQTLSAPLPLDALVALGQSVEGDIWLVPLLDQVERQFSRANSSTEGDLTEALLELLSSSIDALRIDGVPVPQEISVALQHSFENRADDLITAQAAWCWGLILGSKLSYAGSPAAVRLILSEFGHDFVMMEAFFLASARLLHNQNPTLIRTIEQRMQQLSDEPDQFVLGKRSDGFSRTLGAWKELPPQEAFDLRAFTYFPYNFDFLPVVMSLRKIDRGSYLAWLDRIQNPAAMHQALVDKGIREDFGELLSLLGEAPNAFGGSEHGRWASLVAPLLLETALEQAVVALEPFARLPRDEASYKKACEEISSRMVQLVGMLQSRSDGSHLGAQWLLRLVRVKSTLNPWLALPASFAMEAVARVFGDSEEHARPILGWLEVDCQIADGERMTLRGLGRGRSFSARPYRVDVLMARLVLKAHCSDTSDYQEENQLLEDVLFLRDPGLFDPNQNQSPTWRHHLASWTLRDADLAGFWKQRWENLASQRLRAKNPMFTDDRSADEPSHFWCATAICWLENRPSLNQPENGSYLSLWDELYQAIWFQVLFYSVHGEATTWRRLFVFLVGVLPKQTDLTSEHGVEKLAHIWGSLGSDEELITHTLAHLVRLGIDRDALRTSIEMSSLEMEPILVRFESKGDNVYVYPLSEHWKQTNLICRELLSTPNEANGNQQILRLIRT